MKAPDVGSMDKRNLLLECHLFDEQIGALVWRQTLVQPGAFYCLLGGLIRTLCKDSRYGHGQESGRDSKNAQEF
jgi:hypothetical protein